MEANGPGLMTQLAMFEGYRVTKVLLTFQGAYEVDDPELVERMVMGQELSLWVTGTIEQRNHGRTDDGLKATSVFRMESVALASD